MRAIDRIKPSADCHGMGRLFRFVRQLAQPFQPPFGLFTAGGVGCIVAGGGQVLDGGVGPSQIAGIDNSQAATAPRSIHDRRRRIAGIAQTQPRLE